MPAPANLSEQILALPNGAGSVQPSGQTFEVRPYNGTGSYTIPIETQPGHAGLSASLALTYSTHSGNGIAGLGWSLSLAEVQRRTDKGLPTFDDAVDTFALQGDELLPVGGGYYRLRIERRFARIRHVTTNGQDFWVVTERDGTRTFYGLERDHRLHDDAGRIGVWYVSKKQDANGNEVVCSYMRDTATKDVRLTAVEWAGCYRVRFTYEPRPDPFESFRPGFRHSQQHRLASIDAEVRRTSNAAYHSYRSYSLKYRTSVITGRSLLATVAVTGVNPDGETHVLPSLQFAYSEPDLAQKRWHSLKGSLPGGSLQDRNLTLVRQSGGLPDILETTASGHWLRKNLGEGKFAAPRRVTSPAQVLLETPGNFISDMSGDGWGDLVVNGGQYVYRGLAGGGWGEAYTSSHAPALDLDAADVRVADFNADGIPDALSGRNGSWVFFENLGEGTWAPGQPVLNPPPLHLDDPRVHIADVNGDGIPDLIYMDRARVLVWPGEGSGKFAPCYELKHAPDFGRDFDPKAVIWAGIAGSGQADLLYIRNGTAMVCFNRSGIALSDPIALAAVPQSAHGHVEPVDLLGSGAEGLLFTDYQAAPGAWRYLEVFSGGSPDLLTQIDNGLGAVTTIAYTSSAHDWIADQLAGKPWKTSMPSPELVVASLTTYDSVTGNRLGVSYRYHHGVYDGTEREFRGFALVEQIDQEAGRDDPQPLAPVLVKRWYHTGFDVDLADDYAALPEGALKDEIPELPWALRSLRGLQKREETYALDGDPKPYTIQEIAYHVFPIQRTSGTSRYSFAPLPFKSRTTNIERSDERRIVETTTIYDRHSGKGYGLPVERREKAYGRRGVFTTPHEIAQTMDLERFTVTEYVNRDEPEGSYAGPYSPSYLVGKPGRVERWGVSGVSTILLSRERYFYDGESYRGFGYPGTSTTPLVTRGRLSCKLVLALTDDLLAAAFPASSGARAQFDRQGKYLAEGTDHYLHAERFRYTEQGMIAGAKDPNGNESEFQYDSAYALFPVRHMDAAGHPTRLTRGELPFQIEQALDANGNTTGFTYDPCGLIRSKAIQGKHDGSDWTGDPPAYPTESYVYKLDTTPVSIRSQMRQVRLEATIETIRFLDGLGRTIQERHTAEPEQTMGAARYRVSGWQIFNHKGLVVKSYQPFFANTGEYVPGDTTTAVIETHYDPLGRAIRVDYPDGTFETTAHHPWTQTFSDRNDNSRHIAPDDARYGRFITELKKHAGTPGRSFVDALGRVFATVEDNGSELHVFRKKLDLRDQVIELWDGRDLPQAAFVFTYDYAGRPLQTVHATALGERYSLADAAGNPIWARDARGIEVIRTFDVVNRPLEERTSEVTGTKLRRQYRYVAYDELGSDFANYQSKNLFGRVEEERDADGLRFFEYDWRGLPVRIGHRFWSQEDASGRSWDASDAQLWTDGANWDPSGPDTARETLSYLQLSDLTDTTTLFVETTYDASRQPVEITYPEGMKIRNAYNAAGLLNSVEVDRGTGNGYEVAVESQAYNARGQLTYFRHGNGIETSREYDVALERLTRIFTRLEGASTIYFQDLSYSYDPVGNPMEIEDQLATSSFSHNQIIPNTRTFAYDPRYRLVKATGKKHRTVRRKDSYVLITSPDPNDYEPYTIRYAYDAAGNFVRNQEYTAGRLHYKTDRVDLFNGDLAESRSSADPSAGNFRYDPNGNTTHTPRHEELAYTHDNQVRYANLSGGGQVRYFRHGDQRVLRLVKKNGVTALSVYLGAFEYHFRRAATGSTKLVLHVSGAGRHAQAERILAGSDPDSLELFFHHADHLGSGHVLTKQDGELLNQEENFPYGGVSDRRDARNRYRYIGVEQDEDTHLCMTGPRTYDPVSGRFLQGDRVAADRFRTAPYVYASASPVLRLDPGGYADTTGPTLVPIEDGSRVNISGWDEVPLGIAPGGGYGNGLPVIGYEDATTDPIGLPEGRDIRDPVATGDVKAPAESTYPELTGKGNPTELKANAVDDFLENELTELKIAPPPKPVRGVALELAEEAAEVAPSAAKTIVNSTATTGLKIAKIGKLVPIVGIFFAAENIAEAKAAEDQGDYVTAGLKIVGIVYDPVDWAYAVSDTAAYVSQSISDYEAAQRVAGVDAELRRIEAEQRGEPWPPPPPVVYSGPCPACHY